MAHSSQDLWHGREPQPRTLGRRQPRHRSKSRRLSGRRQPEQAMPLTRHRCFGTLYLGDAVHVFSRSAGEWIEGIVAEVMDGDFVYVEYEIGQYLHSKILHLHSEHLMATAISDVDEALMKQEHEVEEEEGEVAEQKDEEIIESWEVDPGCDVELGAQEVVRVAEPDANLKTDLEVVCVAEPDANLKTDLEASKAKPRKRARLGAGGTCKCCSLSMRQIVHIRLCLVGPLAAGIVAFGILEARDLEDRSRALLQASHDSTCFVHVHPYDDQDFELRFEVTNRRSTSIAHHSTHDSSNVVAMASLSSGQQLDFSMGTRHMLRSRECLLVIDSAAIAHGTQFYHYTGANNTFLEDLNFEACQAPMGGEPPTFVNVDNESMPALAALTLAVWAALRLLQIARDLCCINYDVRYPPTSVNPSRGCGVPFPFSCLLKGVTGGDRLLLWNCYRTGLRPYLMYGHLPAMLLKPFTTIRLHDLCPQLIVQTGDFWLTIAAICLSLLVTSLGLVNWLIDLVHWICLKKPEWQARFDKDNGCEHSCRFQGWISNCMCALIVLVFITKIILNWPLEFVVEIRWLFQFNWPSYAVSRWAHVLRVLAFLLWLVDVVSFPAKFVAHRGRLGTLLKLVGQGTPACELRKRGYTRGELQQASISASEMRGAGYSLGELKKAGYIASEMHEVGYSLGELKQAGYFASEMREAGYSLGELKQAGYSASEMRKAGFLLGELTQAGYSASEMREAGFFLRELKQAGYWSGELKQAGYSAYELREAGYSLGELEQAGYSCGELKQAGYSAYEMREAGCSLGELQQAGYSCGELNQAGYSASEMLEAGYSCNELMRARYSPPELREAGYSLGELEQAVYSLKALTRPFNRLPPCDDMIKAGFDDHELKRMGYKAYQLWDNGASTDRYRLKVLGYSPGAINYALAVHSR